MDLTPYKNCFAHKNAVYISTDREPYGPCCFFKKPVMAETWDDYQSQIQKVDIAEGCKYCIDMEAGGATWSHRLQYTNNFYHNENYGRVFVAGVCFDNVCNLKCTTCGPANSSQWISDFTKLDKWKSKDQMKYYLKMGDQAPKKVEFLKNLLATVQYDTFRLDIFGGEPSINPFIIDFIDWLANSEYSKKVMINVTTNGTRLFQKLIDYRPKFKSIMVQVSVDGIENHFEYLRYGGVWKEVSENVIAYNNLCKRYANFTVSLHYTLSWMNALHFADFYKWVYHNLPDIDALNLTKVISPPRYSVDMLSPENKKQIVDQVLNKINELDLSSFSPKRQQLYKHTQNLFVTSMNNYSAENYLNHDLFVETAHELAKLDEIRNTNYVTTFADVLPYYSVSNHGQ